MQYAPNLKERCQPKHPEYRSVFCVPLAKETTPKKSKDNFVRSSAIDERTDLMHSIEEFVNPKWHYLCQTCAADLCRDFNISPFGSDLSHHFSVAPKISNLQALTDWVAKYWLQERYSALYIDPYLSNELHLALSRELADIDYWALYSLEVKS